MFVIRELEEHYWKELASNNCIPPIYGADIDMNISDQNLQVCSYYLVKNK